MSRPKKYTARTLKKAVDAYFDSITRDVELTELVDTGKRDKRGHAVFEPKPIINKLGQQARMTEYMVPPSVKDLCDHLGINRSTWADYAKEDKYPELTGIVQEVHERMKAWNERELLTRSGRDVKGIIFNLQVNYGYGAKRDPASSVFSEDDPITKSLKEAAYAIAQANEDTAMAVHGEDGADL